MTTNTKKNMLIFPRKSAINAPLTDNLRTQTKKMTNSRFRMVGPAFRMFARRISCFPRNIPPANTLQSTKGTAIMISVRITGSAFLDSEKRKISPVIRMVSKLVIRSKIKTAETILFSGNFFAARWYMVARRIPNWVNPITSNGTTIIEE